MEGRGRALSARPVSVPELARRAAELLAATAVSAEVGGSGGTARTSVCRVASVLLDVIVLATVAPRAGCDKPSSNKAPSKEHTSAGDDTHASAPSVPWSMEGVHGDFSSPLSRSKATSFLLRLLQSS